MLLLNRELEARLVAALRVNRARGEASLVEASYGLARGHARALAGRIGLAADEAEEVVGEALLGAARSFDPDGGTRWSTWAKWRLRDALRRQARRCGESATNPWWERSEEDRMRSRKAQPGSWGSASACDSATRATEERLAGPPDQDAPPIDERLDVRRRIEQTERALARLDPRTRQILLWHARGDTPSQMAPRLSLSRNWITVLRTEGMRRLRAAMEPR